MDPTVRLFLARHAEPPGAAVERDVAPYRDMTPEQRAIHLDAACRLAAEVLAASPWRDRILELRDPPHPAWAALIRRHQHG